MQLFAQAYPAETIVLVDSITRNQTSHDPVDQEPAVIIEKQSLLMKAASK